MNETLAVSDAIVEQAGEREMLQEETRARTRGL
jgi:hypothetical protein